MSETTEKVSVTPASDVLPRTMVPFSDLHPPLPAELPFSHTSAWLHTCQHVGADMWGGGRL